MFHSIKKVAGNIALVGALSGAASAQATTNTTTPPATATSPAASQDPMAKALGDAVGSLAKKFGIDLSKVQEPKPVKAPEPKVEPKVETKPAEPLMVQEVKKQELKLDTPADFELAKVDFLRSIAEYEESVKGFKRSLLNLTADSDRNQAWKDMSHISAIELIKLALTQDVITKAMDKKSAAVVHSIDSSTPNPNEAADAVTNYAIQYNKELAEKFWGLIKYLGNNTAFDKGVLGAYVSSLVSKEMPETANRLFRELKINPKTFGDVEDEFVRNVISENERMAAEEQARRNASGIVPGQTVIASPHDPKKDENTALKTLQTVAVYAVPVAGIWAALRYFR